MLLQLACRLSVVAVAVASAVHYQTSESSLPWTTMEEDESALVVAVVIQYSNSQVKD
jgi:hypothetical protein